MMFKLLDHVSIKKAARHGKKLSKEYQVYRSGIFFIEVPLKELFLRDGAWRAETCSGEE